MLIYTVSPLLINASMHVFFLFFFVFFFNYLKLFYVLFLAYSLFLVLPYLALTLQFVMHTFQEDHDPTIGRCGLSV